MKRVKVIESAGVWEKGEVYDCSNFHADFLIRKGYGVLLKDLGRKKREQVKQN